MTISLPDSHTADLAKLARHINIVSLEHAAIEGSVSVETVSFLHYRTADKQRLYVHHQLYGTVVEMCGNGLRHGSSSVPTVQPPKPLSSQLRHLRAVCTPRFIQQEFDAKFSFSKNSVTCPRGRGRPAIPWLLRQHGQPPFCDLRPRSGRYSTARCTSPECTSTISSRGNISFAQHHSDTITLSAWANAGADGLKPGEQLQSQRSNAASWALQSVESVPTTVNLPGGSLTISGTFSDMIMDGPARLTFEGQATNIR